jgi:hypothetical protein
MKAHSITKFTSMAILVALGGCASNTTSRMGTAATTPLSDLNIVRADIPDVLVNAQKHPYLALTGQNCEVILTEIRSLDEVLGADLDAPATGDRPSLIDRASVVAKDQAVNAVQRTAEGLIPFRGWVRKLSGAERYSNRVSASITAGAIRRGFLKGMATSQSCVWQAVPAEVVKS